MLVRMNSISRSDWGRFLLRLAIGGLMLFHGIDKLRHGVGGISGMLESSGLPGAMAYGAYVGEVVAPILLVLGVLTVPAALVVAFNMLVALYVAHSGQLFSLGDHGAWAVEGPALYLLGAIVIALLGPGGITIRRLKS